MTTIIIALLIVSGIILLSIEFFIVPGFSVPGLAGIALIGYGIYRSNAEYSAFGVVVTVTVSVAAALILMKIALKSRAIKSVGLEYSHKGARAVDDYSSLLNKKGKALSDLRPSGTALIDGNRYDVVTEGEYIEGNSDILVHHVEGTRIVVTLVERG